MFFKKNCEFNIAGSESEERGIVISEKGYQINEDDASCSRSLPAFFRKNHKALPFH